jgi:uncharacterized membrane protein YoaK (UPF0700 family)
MPRVRVHALAAGGSDGDRKERTMPALQILVIRAILGAVFGILLMRFFYPDAPLSVVVLLCAILVGLSYLTQYLRRRRK